MTLRVAIDFGTSSTCVVAAVDQREPQVVVIDGNPLLPSAVYAAPDGSLFVGQEAERQAAVDPSRYEPHPKRRIDEGDLLLGSTVLPVRQVVRAVLERALTEARRLIGGGRVDLLVLTHPADWGVVRAKTLRQAAAGLALEVTLVPEPVAAAFFHATTFRPAAGKPLAVLDLGGGTTDVSVVRPDRASGVGFSVLSTRGDPHFGGADVDQILLERVGSRAKASDADAWRNLMEGRDLSERRRRRVLRQDVRSAKETLSRHPYTDVPMPPPFDDAHVTRLDLERLIHDPVGRVVAMTSAALQEAGVAARDLAGIFLVGGSSRIPLVGQMVHERLGVVPTTLDQPETVVARGALRAVLERTPARSAAPRRPAPVRPVPAGPAARAAAAPEVPAAVGVPASAALTEPVPPDAVPTSRVAGPVTSAPRGRRRSVVALGLVGALVLLGGVAAVIVWLATRDGGSDEPSLRAFDFSFSYPSGWNETDRNQSLQQVAVRPSKATNGLNYVTVQRFDIAYDYESARDRFVDDLTAALKKTGKKYSTPEPNFPFANRSVVHYVEEGKGKKVDWFVLVKNKVQVSVGCSWTPTGRQLVESACTKVVGSLEISS